MAYSGYICCRATPSLTTELIQHLSFLFSRYYPVSLLIAITVPIVLVLFCVSQLCNDGAESFRCVGAGRCRLFGAANGPWYDHLHFAASAICLFALVLTRVCFDRFGLVWVGLG